MAFESRTRAHGRVQAYWEARKEAQREQERQGKGETVDQDRLINAIMVSLSFDTEGEGQRLVVPQPGSREQPNQGEEADLAVGAEAGDGEPSTPDQEGPDVVVEDGSVVSWSSNLEEEETREGAVGGCRVRQNQPVVIWQPSQAEVTRGVELTAAVDETTIDTVRALGKVHAELWTRAKLLFKTKERQAAEGKLLELEGITSRFMTKYSVGLSDDQVRSLKDNLAEMVISRVTSARHRGVHEGWGADLDHLVSDQGLCKDHKIKVAIIKGTIEHEFMNYPNYELTREPAATDEKIRGV